MRRAMRIGTTVLMNISLALAGCAGNGSVGSSVDDGNATDDQPAVRTSDATVGNSVRERDTDAKLGLVVTQWEPVKGNDAWCGTMQLCWDSLVDDLNSGNPIRFLDEEKNTTEVANLNEKLFTTGDLSANHYYTYTGPMTNAAKEEISKAIRERFDQESDILGQFRGWSDDADTTDKFLYAMLYRKFSFPTPFSVLENAGFGRQGTNRATGVTYFEAENDAQRKQVIPLYYADADNHAVRLGTKEGDEVILIRNPQGGTLDEMWQNAMQRADKATDDETRPLDSKDSFRCPNLDIDTERSYDEWTGTPFELTGADGKPTPYLISQAMQTLKLCLDNEGGEVKSEAGIGVVQAMAPQEETPTPRHFVYGDTFAMFVRDGNAGDDAYPYVGVLVSDITQFQDGAQKA